MFELLEWQHKIYVGLPHMTRRRTFLKQLALVGVGTQALLRTGNVNAALEELDEARTKHWPEMSYTTLGRTGFNASRLVYGCGAALSRKPADKLLNIAFEKGVNTFDVGTSRYYNDAQRNMASFLSSHREDVFLITKDFVNAGADEAISGDRARSIANQWAAGLDACLSELGQEHVDAYYIMSANNSHVIKSEEILSAFEQAKKAGKVSFLGLSSHENAESVLNAAIDTGKYDLSMLAITPAGWYDWNSRRILPETGSMDDIKPLLARAKEAGIGLVGMKAGRFLAGRLFGGRGQKDVFNAFYDEKLMKSDLSVFQKSYAFVLEHGMDVVNADIQNFQILEENFIAAATSRQYV